MPCGLEGAHGPSSWHVGGSLRTWSTGSLPRPFSGTVTILVPLFYLRSSFAGREVTPSWKVVSRGCFHRPAALHCPLRPCSSSPWPQDPGGCTHNTAAHLEIPTGPWDGTGMGPVAGMAPGQTRTGPLEWGAVPPVTLMSQEYAASWGQSGGRLTFSGEIGKASRTLKDWLVLTVPVSAALPSLRRHLSHPDLSHVLSRPDNQTPLVCHRSRTGPPPLTSIAPTMLSPCPQSLCSWALWK